MPPENLPSKIVIELEGPKVVDVTYHFPGTEEPFSIREFGWGTPTREFLEEVEGVLYGLEYVVGKVVE